MRPSVIRHVHWLDQARFASKHWNSGHAADPKPYWPICNRCGVEVGMFGFEDITRKNQSFEFRARCDHPEHQGRREDVIRADFDWPINPDADPPDPDFERSKRSCVFFPKANDL